MSSRFATTTLGAPPPLILGFHPSKCHAALIASFDQGSIVLAFTFGITRAKAFLMASNASYLDVRSVFLVDLLCASLAYHLRISCYLCASHVLILC